jgi:hypothetical protein
VEGVEGLASPDADASLHSTVHGAGRVMSRTQAAGRVRRRKRWAYSNRDYDRVFDIDDISPSAGVPKGVCPDHPDARLKKVWIEEQIKPGLVDWPPSRLTYETRASCSSAAAQRRRRRCTNASRMSSQLTATRSA